MELAQTQRALDSSDSDSGATPTLADLKYSSRERSAMEWTSYLTMTVMLGCAWLASRYPAFLWASFFVSMFGVIRYIGYIHALNHAYGPSERVPWLLELMPFGFTPLLLGFTEFRWVHITHHGYTADKDDPENFLISGTSRALIFLKCAFTFEHWFFYTIKRHKTSPRFWLFFIPRLALFAGIAWLLGPVTFLVTVLAAKLGIGLAFYIFSYLVHEQHGLRGTFRLPLPPRIERLNWLVIGKYAAQPANYHDIHHHKPWVSCARLDTAALTSELRDWG